MSSRNFFTGRLHLQDSIYLRFSFSATENAAITLEDLKSPQVESDGLICGRIDFSGFEPEQLVRQWDDIVSASYNLNEVLLQMLDDDGDSDDDIAARDVTFTLLPVGFALQQFPYGPDNRTVCGLETAQSIKVELEADKLRFVRERFVEESLSTVVVQNSTLSSAAAAAASAAAAEEGKRISPHVHRRAVITLNQNHGMKRMDTFIRLLSQIKNFMFPSFERLCSRSSFYR
jgi:hypothetical protein